MNPEWIKTPIKRNSTNNECVLSLRYSPGLCNDGYNFSDVSSTINTIILLWVLSKTKTWYRGTQKNLCIRVLFYLPFTVVWFYLLNKNLMHTKKTHNHTFGFVLNTSMHTHSHTHNSLCRADFVFDIFHKTNVRVWVGNRESDIKCVNPTWFKDPIKRNKALPPRQRGIVANNESEPPYVFE